jgi:hypothetical protein
MSACLLMTGDSRPDDAASDYALAPDAALLVTARGNAFAFDMRNSFYALSPVAAAMLERTLRGGKAHAAATIAAEFNTDTARVDADLDLFVGDLEARDFVRRRNANAKPDRVGFLASAIARAARRSLMHLPSASARATAILNLARLSFAVCGWTVTLAAWRRRIPLPPRNAGPALGEEIGTIDDAVRRISAKLPFGGNCKERALSCWAMARVAGQSAALVVGIVQYPLAGHTWCQTADGRILGDDEEHCAPYMPVFRYE